MNNFEIFMVGATVGFIVGWQRKTIVAFVEPYLVKVWTWAKGKVGK